MTPLHGHGEAVAALRGALDAGKLHHAWLIAGPRGVGKALFARHAALRMLVQATGPIARPGLALPVEHPTAKLFEAGSHPDFRLVKREVWDKDGKRIVQEHDRSGTEDLARSIRVLQIRWLIAGLATTTSLAPRRVVVIDAIDDLEPPAANALLKSLEEPPASTVFLLVSHAPDQLLPTIRSRCRLLRLGPLAGDDLIAALHAALPDVGPQEIAALAAACNGAPGRAVAFQGLDVAGMDNSLRALARNGDRSGAQRSDLAGALGSKAARERYEAFLGRATSFIAAEARGRRGADLKVAIGLWEQASALAGVAVRQSLDPQSTVFEIAGLVAQLAPAGQWERR